MVRKPSKESHIIKANVKHNWSEFQKDIFRDIAKGEGHTIIEARAGSAKCLGKGTKVLLYNGESKNVEDILVGDKLMGPDSKPRKVLSINKGFGDLVKIIPTKGDSWICNTDHILTLIRSNSKNRKIIDISVKDYCNRYGHYKDLSKNWKLFKTKINFPSQYIPYDPYFIGLWIGDGTKAEASITNMDPEVIDYCKVFALNHNYLLRIIPEKSKCYKIRFAIGGRGVGHKGTPHLLKRYLLNNCVKNNKKIIPLEYIINSEENRLKLLAGLIDTDGTYARGNFTITSSNKDLAEQYLFLARSLGFASYIKEEVSKIKKLKFYGKCWRVSIIGNCETIPTKIARKRANKRLQIKNPLVNRFKIIPIGIGEFYGFTLNEDGRFLLGDFTVTHNTSSIIESFKYVPKGKKILTLAFNKIIQEELKERSPSYVECLTFHSLGLRAIKQRFGAIQIDDYKVMNIVSDQLDKRTEHDLICNIADTVAFCKYSLSDLPRQIDEIIDIYGIDTCGLDRDKFIKLVINTLSKDKADTTKVDFNDMCWFPYVYNLSLGVYDYVYVDECFPYDQHIVTEDGKMKIGIICNNIQKGKIVPRVLSYNEIENKFEYCNIINGWNRGLKKIIEVRCGKRYVKCSENHKFLTNNGWIEASKLLPGTLIKTSSPISETSQNNGHVQYSLNEDQYQILLGSFLGDGCVNKLRNNVYRLRVIHGELQKNYCAWKAKMFESKTQYISNNGFSKKPAYMFCTKSFAVEQDFPKTKAICPQWILDNIDARGIAIWVMDDGSLNNKSMTIWTCSFDMDSQQRIVQKFQSLGIDCNIASSFSKKKQKAYTFIRFSVYNTQKLLKLIEPYMHKDLLYKINKKEFIKNTYIWNNNYEPFGYSPVTEVIDLFKCEETYDIEVDKNHNFIVCPNKSSKSTTGLIAHNCQDLNRSQLVMGRRVCNPINGRIIGVGDSLQQIYSWRAADNTIINEIKAQPKSKVLSLPICYRCPKKVVELAKNWAEDITCPDTAIEGNIENISLNQLYSKATPGCFILSRTNAPLIKICMNFIRRGIPANIMGRDVGKQLSYLIRKSKKKQIKGFLTWLENWKDEELEKLKQKNISTDNVLDRYECLVNLCDECSTLEEVDNKINSLFNDSDKNNIIICSTVHKSKGSERDNVFILRWTFGVWLDNCSFMDKPNESMNLAYVATTRTKENLYIVSKWGPESDQ